VTEQEKQKLIFDWNDTDSEYPREATIHEMFEEQALKRPEAIALGSEHETITYEELNKYANQIALYLLDSEVEIGSSIGICMDRSVDEVARMLGVLKAGGADVGLDPEYLEERLRYIIQEAKIPMVLTNSQLGLDDVLNSVTTVYVDQLNLPNQTTNIARDGVDATALSNIIYTSGSTGKPKGVCVPHRG